MTRSESKYFHTARRLDETLLSLLSEKDFAYITVKEICDRSGVSRSTFYLHYENTSDLLEEALDMLQQRFQDSLPLSAPVPKIDASSREELFFITDRWLLPWLDFVRENRRAYQALHAQTELGRVDRAYARLFQTLYSPILSRYGVSVEKHGYIMDFYRHGLAAVLMRWVERDCRESAAEIAGIIKLCVVYEIDGTGK